MTSGHDNKPLGFIAEFVQADRVSGIRRTLESVVMISLDRAERDILLKKKIVTPRNFLNHMIETIAWRSCMNICVSVEMGEYFLDHVLCEDVGITLGETLRLLFQANRDKGVNGAGNSVMIIDEALSQAVVSFEERSMCCFYHQAPLPDKVEDMLSADLIAFFEGLAQGARATIHLEMVRGKDPHHLWESAFRAFGEALKVVYTPNEWRSGTTPGVKGI